jgi:hypothetical protein
MRARAASSCDGLPAQRDRREGTSRTEEVRLAGHATGSAGPVRDAAQPILHPAPLNGLDRPASDLPVRQHGRHYLRIRQSVVTLVGGANITVSGSGNQIVIKGGPPSGHDGAGPVISAGTQIDRRRHGILREQQRRYLRHGRDRRRSPPATVKTVTTTLSVPAQTAYVFSDSNGISWGTNGSTVTGTVKTDYLTTARRSTDAIGLNTAQTNIVWTVNSSGLSIDAGAHLTTARASNDAIGLNTAKTNVTWTVNSSGLSLDAGGYLTTAREQRCGRA